MPRGFVSTLVGFPLCRLWCTLPCGLLLEMWKPHIFLVQSSNVQVATYIFKQTNCQRAEYNALQQNWVENGEVVDLRNLKEMLRIFPNEPQLPVTRECSFEHPSPKHQKAKQNNNSLKKKKDSTEKMKLLTKWNTTLCQYWI